MKQLSRLELLNLIGGYTKIPSDIINKIIYEYYYTPLFIYYIDGTKLMRLSVDDGSSQELLELNNPIACLQKCCDYILIVQYFTHAMKLIKYHIPSQIVLNITINYTQFENVGLRYFFTSDLGQIYCEGENKIFKLVEDNGDQELKFICKNKDELYWPPILTRYGLHLYSSFNSINLKNSFNFFDFKNEKLTSVENISHDYSNCIDMDNNSLLLISQRTFCEYNLKTNSRKYFDRNIQNQPFDHHDAKYIHFDDSLYAIVVTNSRKEIKVYRVNRPLDKHGWVGPLFDYCSVNMGFIA